jgi:hypothetical protein
LKDLGLGIQEKHINNKKDFKFNPFDYNVDYITYTKRTKLLSSSTCVVCASTQQVEIHHVKTFRQDNVDSINNDMIGITHRKQICLCRICHVNIHNDSYEEKDISFLQEDTFIEKIKKRTK